MADLREPLQEALAGRYQLERELGRGGMATVYLAHDLKHDRLVALKVLHLDLAATLGPERFQQEIRTTARLQHPHILPVLDSGEATGQLWYTMPYVEGEALRDRLRREGQLPLDDALRITREVADALSYAHDHGLVHRDIKPENILLGRGHALVADFGIARALQVTDAEPLTATGVAVGTPAYMSPEQAGGTPNVDGRSDLYSLGCVLYEMLAGEVPYTGRTPQAVIAKRILEPLPHVRTLRASVPEAVEQAISRALAVSPADRFATAAEFTRALAQPINRSGTTNSSVAPQSMEIYGRRHTARRLALLALGVLLAVGVLLAWLRTRSEPLKVGPRRLAVLPFENLGRPEDEYFADGVTDEVRGKLAALPGLEVIARASSREYKQSSKRPQQIGRELGVDYLLTGTVRWEKNTDGSSRVRVSPELIHASTASAKWQTPFEASLTDVFQVQGRIAADVAQALGVILGATDREGLKAPPTRNMAAYDAFLRGVAAKSAAEFDIPALHRAQEEFDEAVRLDSTFARAWAELSVVLATLYSLDVSSMSATQDQAARKAAERALALAPDQPYGYWALGTYFGMVQLDNARALKEFARGQRIAPQDAGLLAGLGASEFFIGRLEQALVHQRQAEVLDPRSTSIAAGVATVLLALRRYEEAMTTVNRLLALEPDNLLLIHTKMQVYLADADLAGARRVLQAAASHVNPRALVVYTAVRGDLSWVLDGAQQRLLLSLPPSDFGNSEGDRAFAFTIAYQVRGDSALVRAYADSTRMAFGEQLRRAPKNPVLHAVLGLALGYLGDRAGALREVRRAVELAPLSKTLQTGGYALCQLARVHVLRREPGLAVEALNTLLKAHYPFISPGWLTIDPTFAPLRGDPRFERLVNGS